MVTNSSVAIVSGGLQNTGLDYAGVKLTASPSGCGAGVQGETIEQDLDIKVDLLLPPGLSTRGQTLIVEGGPFFRSRASSPGDGIGGPSGYWAYLTSKGDVRVQALASFGSVMAATKVPAAFDTTVYHTLEAVVKGSALQVYVDGNLQSFTSGAGSVTSVSWSVRSPSRFCLPLTK
jgi:hypothetical protein